MAWPQAGHFLMASAFGFLPFQSWLRLLSLPSGQRVHVGSKSGGFKGGVEKVWGRPMDSSPDPAAVTRDEVVGFCTNLKNHMLLYFQG
eukprot:12463229-Heterocapsa_arctica.AAC.1